MVLVAILSYALGSILDPVAALGYVASGLLARLWWQAALGAVAWAIAATVLINVTLAHSDGIYYSPQVIALKSVAFAAASGAVYAIKKPFTRRGTS